MTSKHHTAQQFEAIALTVALGFSLITGKAVAFSSSNNFPSEIGITFPEAIRIQEILKQSDAELDLARIKLTVDKMIDPKINVEASIKQIDHVVATIRRMLGKNPSSQEKMLALKKYLYEPGPWNNSLVYQYDFDDPMGTKIANKLLPNYMRSRKGNCISMPLLFIVLGDRLGIKVTAARAPLHVFVKYTDNASGMTYSLETTSGGNPTRDIWYQQEFPMTDEAIRNGLYLQPLSKSNTVIVMAETLAEHYMEIGEYEKAIALSNLFLMHNPKDVNAMVRKSAAYYRLLDKHFLRKYKMIGEIPAEQRGYYHHLGEKNRFWFEVAEAQGWREPEKGYDERYLKTVTEAAKATKH